MSFDSSTPRNGPDDREEHRDSENLQPIETDVVGGAAGSTSESESVDSAKSSTAEVVPPNSRSMESLHPTSLLFDVVAHGRTYIIPVLIALFSAASGTWGGVWFAAIFFIPAIATSTVRYFTLRFVIRNSELVVTEGLLFRKVRIVPVQRIQNVDLVQNVLHRLIGVAEVRVETASGTEPEAVLRVLSLAKIAHLREAIFSRRSGEVAGPVAGDLVATATETTSDPEVSETVLQIPTGWLVRAGLASNRGFVMVGILLGLYFQFDQDFKFLEKWNIQQAADWLTGNFGFWGQLLIGILTAMVLLILLRLVGIAWFLLQFHGYRLVRIGEDLRISCGLFTKVSATVPVRRVQFISVHQNLIMRWMSMASIRIETAGGAGSEKESATTTVGRRWFIPVLPVDQVPSILNRLRKDLQWSTEDLDWHSLAPRAGYRLLRLALIQSCFFFLLIAFGVVQALYLNHPGALSIGSWWPFSVALGVIIPPVLMIHAFKQSRSKKYARTDYGVVYRSGILTRKTSVTFFEKIQTLRIDQSPFDRRWKMARLSIDTAAAGPADHLISVPYLDAAFAKQEFAELNRKTACHQPRYS
ncbi:MAG: PH domain-containing protein [Planctomycetota bacterium]|nr:PH domain-containing protein [Planctomycetota bacterium]